jgi:hypothetical protein
MSEQARLRPSEGVVSKKIGDSAVLIHLHSNRIFELNTSAAWVWSLLEQGAGRGEICARLHDEFSVSRDEARSTVDELLTELTREGLVGG